MTWKPSDDVDQSVREWMKAKDWGVTRTNWDAGREVYAWRHDVQGGSSRLAVYQPVPHDLHLITDGGIATLSAGQPGLLVNEPRVPC